MATEKPCLKVPKRLGEKVRRRLAGQSLLDTGYKIRQEKGYILFPLVRPLEKEEAERLGGEPCRALFEERRKRLASVKEYIEEKMGRPLEDAVYSYSMVGDIALVSMKPEQVEKYGRLVGEAIAAIHPSIRAVYAKTLTAGDFRVQRLVHLYGERRTWTIYKEHGIRFWVDVSKMYVNPSLAEEHRRVAEDTRDGELVLDMFSGFGGFSIHTARLRAVVTVAIDINPHAVAALRRSLKLNRLRGEVHPLQCDARWAASAFKARFTRIIANNPLSIHEFSAPICRLASRGAKIHYYLLAGSGREAEESAVSHLSREGCLAEPLASRRVIDYSPYRYIYAVDLVVRRATRKA